MTGERIEFPGPFRLSQPFVEPAHAAKGKAKPVTRGRVARIQFDCAPEVALGLGPIPVVVGEDRGERSAPRSVSSISSAFMAAARPEGVESPIAINPELPITA